MSRRFIPYIFLIVLLLLLTFTVGVKYGTRVEKVNKTIAYLISITPVPTTAQEPVKYETYTFKECGISFLYPSILVAVAGDEKSVGFTNKGKRSMNIDCNLKPVYAPLTDTKVATAEVTFKTKKTPAKSYEESHMSEFSFIPPGKEKVTVLIDHNLYPLFENTVKFLP